MLAQTEGTWYTYSSIKFHTKGLNKILVLFRGTQLLNITNWYSKLLLSAWESVFENICAILLDRSLAWLGCWTETHSIVHFSIPHFPCTVVLLRSLIFLIELKWKYTLSQTSCAASINILITLTSMTVEFHSQLQYPNFKVLW